MPTDWHLPTDEEWKVLEGAVDSQYGIGNLLWDNDGYSRGFDAGLNISQHGIGVPEMALICLDSWAYRVVAVTVMVTSAPWLNWRLVVFYSEFWHHRQLS